MAVSETGGTMTVSETGGTMTVSETGGTMAVAITVALHTCINIIIFYCNKNITTLRNDFESGTMLSSLDPKSTVIVRQIPVARKLKLLFGDCADA